MQQMKVPWLLRKAQLHCKCPTFAFLLCSSGFLKASKWFFKNHNKSRDKISVSTRLASEKVMRAKDRDGSPVACGFNRCSSLSLLPDCWLPGSTSLCQRLSFSHQPKTKESRFVRRAASCADRRTWMLRFALYSFPSRRLELLVGREVSSPHTSLLLLTAFPKSELHLKTELL